MSPSAVSLFVPVAAGAAADAATAAAAVAVVVVVEPVNDALGVSGGVVIGIPTTLLELAAAMLGT